MTASAARVEIVPATPEQEPILADMFQIYAHDFSAFHPIDLGEDGRFHYAALPLYWKEENRHAFLIRVDRKIAGFALVQRGSQISSDPSVWDMAEFFVTPEGRRNGTGTEAARLVFGLFAGRWEVRVMQANQAARVFWEHAIARFTGRPAVPAAVVFKGEPWSLFSLDAARVPDAGLRP